MINAMTRKPLSVCARRDGRPLYHPASSTSCRPAAILDDRAIRIGSMRT